MSENESEEMEIDSGDEDLHPIYDMIIKIRRNLVALTLSQLMNETFGPSDGIRGVTGVGLVRVDDTNDVNWVYVACADLQVEYCDRHRYNQPMTLLRVRSGTDLNLKGTLFFRCGVPLGGRTDKGYPRICGNNVYLAYSFRKLEAELVNPNEIDRPFMFKDGERC